MASIQEIHILIDKNKEILTEANLEELNMIIQSFISRYPNTNTNIREIEVLYEIKIIYKKHPESYKKYHNMEELFQDALKDDQDKQNEFFPIPKIALLHFMIDLNKSSLTKNAVNRLFNLIETTLKHQT